MDILGSLYLLKQRYKNGTHHRRQEYWLQHFDLVTWLPDHQTQASLLIPTVTTANQAKKSVNSLSYNRMLNRFPYQRQLRKHIGTISTTFTRLCIIFFILTNTRCWNLNSLLSLYFATKTLVIKLISRNIECWFDIKSSLTVMSYFDRWNWNLVPGSCTKLKAFRNGDGRKIISMINSWEILQQCT